MKTDSLFYRLFQRCPQLAMELLALKFNGASYCFGSEEIKQTAFRIDGIFKPLTDNPQQPLIFTEVQYQPDEDFYGRFFSEITFYLYRQKPKRPWLALVIYPTRSVEKTAPVEFRPFMALPMLRRIYLEDYQQGQLSFNLQLIRLIACDEKQTVNLVQALLNESVEIDTETLDFIETILVYKLPRLSREEIRKMLNVQNVELKQTRFYQDVWAEGREEGRQEGREEWQQEGEKLLLQRMLMRRFGALPAWAKNKLRTATAQQVEHWADRLLDAVSLQAVFDDIQPQ